jgi:hypothetical protein
MAALDEFPDSKGAGLSGYLSTHVVDHYRFLDTLCKRTCLFLKFKIDTEGKVINISGNIDADTVIYNAFKSALLSTNNRWSPHMVAGRPIESPYFLQPIYIHSQLCKDDIKPVDTLSVNFAMGYKFDDGTTLENDVCIFLKPAIIVTLY